MRTLTRRAAAALAAALTVTLAGCGAPSIDVPTETVAPSASATPTPTPTPTPTEDPVPQVGDEIGFVEKYDLPEHLAGYTFEGTEQKTVVIDATGPLPAEVLADIQARLDAATKPTAILGTLARNTGREIIVVYETWGARRTGDETWIWVVAHFPRAIADPPYSKEEAVAIAEAHIAAQDNPDQWLLFVLDERKGTPN